MDLGFGVYEFRVWGFRDLGIRGLGFKMHGLGFAVWALAHLKPLDWDSVLCGNTLDFDFLNRAW